MAPRPFVIPQSPPPSITTAPPLAACAPAAACRVGHPNGAGASPASNAKYLVAEVAHLPHSLKIAAARLQSLVGAGYNYASFDGAGATSGAMWANSAEGLRTS